MSHKQTLTPFGLPQSPSNNHRPVNAIRRATRTPAGEQQATRTSLRPSSASATSNVRIERQQRTTSEPAFVLPMSSLCPLLPSWLPVSFRHRFFGHFLSSEQDWEYFLKLRDSTLRNHSLEKIFTTSRNVGQDYFLIFTQVVLLSENLLDTLLEKIREVV